MGHAVINKGNKGITLKDIRFSSYKRLIALGQTISAKMGAAVATFATPTPDLTDLDTAVDNLVTATQPMGLKRNRSSKIQTSQAQKAANDVRVLLQQLLQYSVNTVLDLFPEDPYSFNATLATAGFSVKNKRKPKHITQVRFVTQSNSKKFPASLMRLNWRRGTGLLKGAPIAGYLVKAPIESRVVRTSGYQDLLYDPTFDQATPTGLNPTTTYHFKIKIDGGAWNTIDVDGSLCNKFSNLFNVIHALLNSLGLNATIEEIQTTGNSHLRFISKTKGVNSSIELGISGIPSEQLFENTAQFNSYAAPVQGTDTTIPSIFGVVGTTTKTNFILNPTGANSPNITGQIVPFNSLGEGNPMPFTAQYII